jgi:hypothetical protein
MKKLIFITLILSLTVTTVIAQDVKAKRQGVPDKLTPIDDSRSTTPTEPTNYYPNTSGTIMRSGYTYKYRNDPEYSWPIAQLYNASTTYLDMEWGYKDGSKISLEKFMGEDETPDFSSRSLDYLQRKSLVDGFFTSTQKTSLKGNILSIYAIFDSSTGKIADVYFTFNRNSPLANVPVDTYRSIELALKENFTVTVTDTGRKLNFIPMHWSQKF